MSEIDNSEAAEQLAQLSARLRVLEDEREIREVLSLYAFTADMGMGRAWARLYTEDGRIDLGAGRFGAPANGRDAYVGHEELYEFMNGPAHKSQEGHCQHHTIAGPLVIHVDGDNAIVEGYSVVIVESDEHERRTRVVRPVKPELNVSVANFNHWTLRRVEGRWHIVERKNRGIGDPSARQVLAKSLDGMGDD